MGLQLVNLHAVMGGLAGRKLLSDGNKSDL